MTVAVLSPSCNEEPNFAEPGTFSIFLNISKGRS